MRRAALAAVLLAGASASPPVTPDHSSAFIHPEAPGQWKHVKAGAYRARIERSGFLPVEAPFSVKEGETTVLRDGFLPKHPL